MSSPSPQPIFVSPDSGEGISTYYGVFLSEERARDLLRIMDLADSLNAGEMEGAALSFPLSRFGFELSNTEVSLLEKAFGPGLKDEPNGQRSLVIDSSLIGAEIPSLHSSEAVREPFGPGGRAYITRNLGGRRILDINNVAEYDSSHYQTFVSREWLTRPEVILALCRTAPASDLPSLLERLGEENLGMLVHSLQNPLSFPGEKEGSGRDLRPHCSHELLARLLESTNALIRQKAICMAGSIGTEVKNVPMAKKRVR